MQTSLPLLAAVAFVLCQASVDVQVMSPKLQSRSLAFDLIDTPLRLTNVTQWIPPSPATTRDLDIAPRGPTGVSTYLEHEKRLNNGVMAGVWGGIAAGFANSLVGSCSIGGVLTFGGACAINLAFFFFSFAAANYFAWKATKRSLDEVVWTLDPQYIPTINGSLRSTLAANAPQDKFTAIGNITTPGNFYHLHYFRSSNSNIRGLKFTRNVTLSHALSKNKRQEQGDWEDDEGSDGETDYSAYIYWGDPDESEFEYEEANYDQTGVEEGMAESYADYVVDNELTIVCADTYVGGYSDNEMVSLWYWSPTPGDEYEIEPDEVQTLMNLCNTLGNG
ncbi:uncharacterized protein LY89DRAFT_741433 [Mollisia scopiformis]|uniref:Uncharacterized protein n=1 Tax=Mollisia scopiformis TaxID=149040 RepID=A0A132B9Q9_MOLSC|nr:uncharacterized protein LY89DRAFT_741433 [Mollisia scopiformis]KUJ09138.1 hypothetical protein LY89DRAFT_741433 [Mollisia scopiformis]